MYVLTYKVDFEDRLYQRRAFVFDTADEAEAYADVVKKTWANSSSKYSLEIETKAFAAQDLRGGLGWKEIAKLQNEKLQATQEILTEASKAAEAVVSKAA